jgi:hypothetical protein
LEQVWNLGIIAKCYCSQVSKIITKLKNFDSFSNPKEMKVLIKFWKLRIIFTTLGFPTIGVGIKRKKRKKKKENKENKERFKISSFGGTLKIPDFM